MNSKKFSKMPLAAIATSAVMLTSSIATIATAVVDDSATNATDNPNNNSTSINTSSKLISSPLVNSVGAALKEAKSSLSAFIDDVKTYYYDANKSAVDPAKVTDATKATALSSAVDTATAALTATGTSHEVLQAQTALSDVLDTLDVINGNKLTITSEAANAILSADLINTLYVDICSIESVLYDTDHVNTHLVTTSRNSNALKNAVSTASGLITNTSKDIESLRSAITTLNTSAITAGKEAIGTLKALATSSTAEYDFTAVIASADTVINKADCTLSDIKTEIEALNTALTDAGETLPSDAATQAEIQKVTEALRATIATAESKGYTGNIIKDSRIWQEFADSLDAARTMSSQINADYTTSNTPEQINAANTRLVEAMDVADTYKAEQDELALQAQVDGVKQDIRDILSADDVPTENDVFPSVWSTFSDAINTANSAIDDTDISYNDIVAARKVIESAVEIAKKNVPIKAEADVARTALQATLTDVENKDYNSDTIVDDTLYNTLMTLVDEANTLIEDKESLAADMDEKRLAISTAMINLDDNINGTITLSDIRTSISMTGLGFNRDIHEFITDTSTITFNSAMKIQFALKRTENEYTTYISPMSDDISIVVPLTKNFNGLKKVYLYRLSANANNSLVYTAVDESKMSISDNGMLTLSFVKGTDFDDINASSNKTYFGQYAMSRVPLNEDGSQDKSSLGEIGTTSLYDQKSNVAVESESVDFSNAELDATVITNNNTTMTVDFTIYDRNSQQNVVFGNKKASMTVPITNGTIADTRKLYVYNVNDNGIYTETKNSTTYRKVLFDISSASGKYVISTIKLNNKGEIASGEVTPTYLAPRDKFTSGLFEDVIAQNKTQNVEIRNSEGVSFTFKANTMSTVDDVTSYDFTTKSETGFDNLSNMPSSLTADNFVLHVDYAYSGNLPAMARIKINVGTKWAGKTLFYSQIMSDKSAQLVQRVVIDTNGFATVEQDHCSDYVFSTENIAKGSSSGGTNPGDNTDNDDIIEGNDKTTITSALLDISVVTSNVVPNGATLDLNAINVDSNTTKYTSFVVKNGIGAQTTLKGKATVKIPLGEKFSGAKNVYVYTSDDLNPVTSEIENGYLIFDVDDITQVIAVSTNKWAANATPAKVTGMVVKDTTLKNNNIILTGKLPVDVSLKTETLNRNSTSYGVKIDLVNSKGLPVAFNDDYMTAKVTIKLEDAYASANKLYVYIVSNGNGRAAVTNAKYMLVNSSVRNGNLTFDIDAFDTYVISMVALDADGSYVEADAIKSAKDALNNYIKTLNVDTSKCDKTMATRYNDALKSAKDVVNNKDATLKQVESAMDILTSVAREIDDANTNAAEIAAAKKELQTLIDKKYDESKYTTDSYKTYSNALSKAKTIVNNEKATLTEVNGTKNTLKSAIDSLKEKSNDKDNETSKPNDTSKPDTSKPTNTSKPDASKPDSSNKPSGGGLVSDTTSKPNTSTPSATTPGGTTITPPDNTSTPPNWNNTTTRPSGGSGGNNSDGKNPYTGASVPVSLATIASAFSTVAILIRKRKFK